MTIQFISMTYDELAKYLERRDQAGLILRDDHGIVFIGKHHDHYLTRTDNGWGCDCRSFQILGWCYHVKVLHYQVEHAFAIPILGRSDAPMNLPVDFTQAALAGA